MKKGRHAAALLFAGAAACGEGGGPAKEPDPFAGPVVCSSGVMHDSNESEGPLMMPGHACNTCHADFNAANGESAPLFRLAGTVYATGHEPDNCVGVGKIGAEVWLTDATGFVVSAKVNATGNFELEARLPVFVPPYTAKVIYQGRERAMVMPQRDGDCNVCHTEAGFSGAPGRIVLP